MRIPKEFVHAFVLVITLGLSFLFARTPLRDLDLQVTAVLFILLFINRKYAKENRLLESIIFTFAVSFLVNTTGGTTSPFFFLMYFLLFAISLLLEPVISLVVTSASVVFFLLGTPGGLSFYELLPVFSLAFLTPFAQFMGQEYQRNVKLKTKSEKDKKEMFLFLSLILKNHLKAIRETAENFRGDKELGEIKKNTAEMERLIDTYEKTA